MKFFRNFPVVKKRCYGTAYDFDLAVIGGGSGGMAVSTRAATLNSNLKIAVFDFVKPSPHGTSWGVGGTCVNVGCIPKKLMHTASLQADMMKLDMPSFGFELDKIPNHNWSVLSGNVNNYIKGLQFAIKVDFRKKGIKYFDAYAKFKDPHTLEIVDKKGKTSTVTAEKFVLSAGGRPVYPDIPGIEHAITSDDIFTLDHPPGRTLCVGASYVSLETAGFLSGLGHDSTVMMRSIPLRGFDQECANKVVDYMEAHGTHFIREATPTRIDKKDDKLVVTFNQKGELKTEVFDTVMFATGRKSVSRDLNLHEIGVALDSHDKVIVDKHEKSSLDHIYAIGDMRSGGIELTPVAIQAGSYLAKHLYGGSNRVVEYDLVPSTVFTPIEYGTCGLSEEEAIKRFGEENIEVYQVRLNPLEYHLSREENVSFMKR
jgi:thioredoxin/glutathione reductase (selenoprotein)